MTNTTREIANRLSPFISETVRSHPVLRDTLDPDAVDLRTRPNASGGSGRLISMLGVATAALLATFGRDIFRLSMRETVRAKLNDLLGSAPAAVEHSIENYKKLLKLHEECIASIMRQTRGQKTLSAPVPAPANHLPIRYIDIKNDGEERTYYALQLAGQPRTAWRELPASDCFTWPIQYIGDADIILRETGTKIQLKLTRDRESYSVVFGDRSTTTVAARATIGTA